MTNRSTDRLARDALSDAQNRLSLLLIAERPDMRAIIAAADLVERLEREAERRPVLRVPSR